MLKERKSSLSPPPNCISRNKQLVTYLSPAPGENTSKMKTLQIPDNIEFFAYSG